MSQPTPSPSTVSVTQTISEKDKVAGDEYVFDEQWYKSIVFYEVYIRAFCDGNGDGKGDIPGLISNLDYLQELGVYCIWILPCYPSPLKDDGYDVSDYCNVHPDYGSLKDVERLIKAAHERSMKIIFDFIPNHCSDQHIWFQEARKSRDSPFRDYFVWSDTPDKFSSARIIFLDVEQSNWTWDPVAGQYYWHRFFSSQPDLNFENPIVQQEMLNVLKFWLDMGVDGFRCDAVPYLFEEENSSCENLPQTHVFLKKMRAFIDCNYPGRIMLAEACQLPHQVREYFADGDEFHLGFHFPVMPQIYKAIASHTWCSLKETLDNTPPIPESCQWVTFLRNHDELSLEMVTLQERHYLWEKFAPEPRMRLNLGIRRRLAPLFENDRRRIELAHNLLLTMPGTPILYYGDEIGMGDNVWLPDRNGVRTPMQWRPCQEDPTAGFSANPNASTYSPLMSDPVYNPDNINVADAMKDASSIFHVIKFMIRTRKNHPCFSRGTLMWLSAIPPNPQVATYVRQIQISSILVVANLGDSVQRIRIPLPSCPPTSPDLSAQLTSSASPASAPTIFDPTLQRGLNIRRPSYPRLKRWESESGMIQLPVAVAIDNLTELADELTGRKYPISKDNTIGITLQPYEFLWLNLREAVFKY